MSAFLTWFCWGFVIAAVLAGLLWDRIANVVDVWRGVKHPELTRAQDATWHGFGAPTVADPFCDEFERLFEAPCAPDPRMR